LKRIEELIRTSDWSPALRAEFFAHLEKRMSDDARAGYCRRKSGFMLRALGRRQAQWALELVEFALGTFAKMSKQSRAYLLAERANALDAMGKKKSAAAAYRSAKRLNRNFA
jgi:hypothetical protein